MGELVRLADKARIAEMNAPVGGKPTPTPAPAAGAPAVGTIKEYQGKKYRFKGGDSKKKENWELLADGSA